MESVAGNEVEFLAEVIENVGHPVFVKDRDFRFVFVNQALCEVLGYRREELLGKTDYDFFPKEQADFFREKDLEMLATGAQVTIDEEPITDADGQELVLATVKAPRRDARGEITHVIGIVKDITEAKRAERALRDQNEELERRVAERTAELASIHDQLLRKERLAMLGELAGGLAHQIRNPLGVIQNAVALLARLDGSETEREAALRMIAEEVDRANRFVADLLEYARVRPPSCDELDVRHLVEAVLSRAKPPTCVVVETRIAEGTLAWADPLQVQTALLNVVRNAVEAMPQGGRLRIDATNGGSQVTLLVADEGPGVSPDLRPRLFQPLVTGKPAGTGLGLSTAKSLIENNGGSLGLDESSAGACFRISLPAPDTR